MKKKLITITACFVLAGSIFAGCGNTDTNTSDDSNSGSVTDSLDDNSNNDENGLGVNDGVEDDNLGLDGDTNADADGDSFNNDISDANSDLNADNSINDDGNANSVTDSNGVDINTDNTDTDAQ